MLLEFRLYSIKQSNNPQAIKWEWFESRQLWPKEGSTMQGCGVRVGVAESESEGILGGVGVGVGVGVGKNVPTPTPTSVWNLN
jgi:hypothetical protein